MLDKLADVERRYVDLEERLIDPSRAWAAARTSPGWPRSAPTSSRSSPRTATGRSSRRRSRAIGRCSSRATPTIRELAKAELPGAARAASRRSSNGCELLLLPKDPNDDRNVVLEIRAGTGGEEASLFAAELFRMYSRYAEAQGWRVEVLSANATGLGGFKEIIALIEGQGAYSKLKFEGGVHRVQRVPVTEASGRIHTSAVTVAVLPEAEDVEVDDRRGQGAAHRRLPLLRARAGRASTPPTPRCASPTCRPAWW